MALHLCASCVHTHVHPLRSLSSRYALFWQRCAHRDCQGGDIIGVNHWFHHLLGWQSPERGPKVDHLQLLVAEPDTRRRAASCHAPVFLGRLVFHGGPTRTLRQSG
ncbi:hypothetical protein D3C76_488550 [compost metagenome]